MGNKAFLAFDPMIPCALQETVEKLAWKTQISGNYSGE
jgi:hypothetical protein